MGVDPHYQTQMDRLSARIADIGDWMNLQPLEWSLRDEPADECGLGVLIEAVGTVPANYDAIDAELLALEWADALNLTEQPTVLGRREFTRPCEESDDMPVDRIRIRCISFLVQDL
jgi:hypothetical protein